MRITAADIPSPGNKLSSSTTPSAADKTSTGQQKIGAGDSYNSATSPRQIIDAEYVEFYAPATQAFKKELQTLDNTLTAEKTNLNSTSGELGSVAYQPRSYDAPPSGSYIDIFA